MSTTLKALNRLEQRLPNCVRENGPDSQKQGGLALDNPASIKGLWRHPRSKVLILICAVGLILCLALVTVLNRPSSPSKTIVSHHPPPDHVVSSERPTATATPVTSASGRTKDTQPVPSEKPSQSRSSSSGIDRRSENNDDRSSMSDPQEEIPQWFGDGLKLQAIVLEPSAGRTQGFHQQPNGSSGTNSRRVPIGGD